MDYRIRFATPDDHDLIYALKAESVRLYVEKIWGWDEDYQKKDFDGDFSHMEQFNVIEIDGSFAGFVQYYFEYPYFEVVEIHLLPEYRGKGIGSGILRYLQKVCTAQDRKIRIGCFKENRRAKALYQNLGFMQTKETDTHYILEYPNYISENNRVAFVQYTHEDDGDMFACWQNPDTQKGYNYAFDGSLNDLSNIEITAFPFWVVVVEKASGAKIGVLRLSGGEEQDLAIWIYPQHRGKGYGTEAFSLAVDYILRNMNLRKIYAGCYCDNKASLQMLEKAGFDRYPDGDQQEVNCFTGEPTTQLSFVKTNALETKDLILRQGSADDWQDLYRNLWSWEEVFRYMFKNPCPSEEHAAARTGAYAVMHESVKTEFFICEKASGQAIGIAGIKELKPGKWTITDIAIGPDFQGRGYGKQIVTALMKLAFVLGATELAYVCFTQNDVSKRLALSCGFVYSHSEEAELMKNDKKVILDYYEVRK